MGMSGSQARLLSITSRLNDVEFKAQGVMAQKVSLATRRDRVYKEYTEALDATKYEVMVLNPNTGYTNYIEANYKNCCMYNDNMIKQYALRNNQTNKIMASPEIVEAYELYGNDKYTFAYAMMGFDGCFSESPYHNTHGCEIGVGEAQDDYGYYSNVGTGYDLYLTDVEKSVMDEFGGAEFAGAYDEIVNEKDDALKKEKLLDFRDALYKKLGAEIFEATQDIRIANDSRYSGEDDTYSDVKREIEYYATLWEAIDEAGGYELISEDHVSGENCDEWFKNMVEAGLITIMEFDATGYEDEWSDTAVSISLGMNYLQEVPDEELIKKAEIEYEYKLGLINDKDAEYDKELNELEIESSALKQEIESLNTVIGENIDRSLDIFQ